MLAKSSRAHESDADLVSNIVQGVGRERAEAELYARYQRRAYLYGLKHLRDADAAWDLAQEALGTLLKKIHARELDDPTRLGSFLLGICRMLALGLGVYGEQLLASGLGAALAERQHAADAQQERAEARRIVQLARVDLFQ